jgi:PIN domain nuclease of toxin-antitoxin system
VAARASDLATGMDTGEPADRLTCVTADVHTLPLISADRAIRSARVDVVW